MTVKHARKKMGFVSGLKSVQRSSGKCHTAQINPEIRQAAWKPNRCCSRGNRNPRHPSSSPSDYTASKTTPTVNNSGSATPNVPKAAQRVNP
jgi:hypothetical protein